MTITIIGKRIQKRGKHDKSYQYVECECSCGKILTMQISNAKKAKSCGCMNPRSKSHLMTGTKTYLAWNSMINRCYQEKHKRYKDYGGRGIRVCEEWKQFINFFNDMGECDGLTLDRIDNEGSYCKENCKWSTKKEQARNRRNTKYVTIDGVTKSLGDWVEESPFCYATVFSRLSRGWIVKEAIFGKQINRKS